MIISTGLTLCECAWEKEREEQTDWNRKEEKEDGGMKKKERNERKMF